MKQISRLVVFIVGIFAAATQAALPVQTVFTGEKSEHTWPLAALNPNLPADWTGYDFLVIEFKASSSQRFDLGLKTANGHYALRIGPFAGVWVRAAIPLRFYRQPPGSSADLAATYNQPRNSYWFKIGVARTGPTTNVTGITVAMNNPVGAPTLAIRSVTLATNDLGDAVLEGKPLVDEFGQYTHAEWPGKAHSLAELKSNWTAETAALRTGTMTNRDAYGGFLNTRAAATGFFRVEQVDGRWWFVDPDGHLFFSTGMNGVLVDTLTRVEGREDLFAALPPVNLIPAVIGEAGHGLGGSFYAWNLLRRFGADWPHKWAEETTERLTAWGFNTVHNWGKTNLVEPRVPYALMLHGWQTGNSIMSLPDVYADDFARRVDEVVASQIEPRRNDSFMLGFFIGNEPSWPGRESVLCKAILAAPPSEIQKRLKTFLAAGDTPQRQKEFVLTAFQRYLDTINAAVRKYDTNHLNLGIRFGGSPHDEVLKAARVFDVLSVNIYGDAPSKAVLDHIYALTQRPILIGEFHMGAPDRGLSQGLVLTMNQKERATGYSYYMEQCAAHPEVIGALWFQWLDQPVTGRKDGENYNIGFVDVTDQSYPDMVAAAKHTNERLLEIHSGKIPPVEKMPKISDATTP